jgi:anti-sigma factor RsiW
MRRDASNTSELLAAYVDGVSELTTDERKRVEARLAGDASLRAEAGDLRALLGELRELPPQAHTSEPDWHALERSIGEAVGPSVPRPWWRRRWRWLVPSLGLVVSAAAILVVIIRHPDSGTTTGFVVAPPPREVQEPAADVVGVWLDGNALEVDPTALDDALDELEPALADDGDDGDFAFLDELDDATLERVRAALDAHAVHRKKG